MLWRLLREGRSEKDVLGALIAPSRNCKSVLRLPPAFAEDLVTPTEGFFWGMALHSPRLVGFL